MDMLLIVEKLKYGQKDIRKLLNDVAKLVKKAIEGLTESPPKRNIKTMQGYSDGRKRLRVGKYRVIYQYLNNSNVYV